MRIRKNIVLSLLVLSVFMTSVYAESNSRLGFELAPEYNTPDGMTIDANGDILINFPNTVVTGYPAKLAKITKDNKLVDYYTYPLNEDTGKHCQPLGIAIGPDGNFYVADNQSFHALVNKSRLLKLTVKDGEVIDCAAVATGFQMANGVAIKGDYVYVNETAATQGVFPHKSGTFRFKISELDPKNPIRLQLPGTTDPHMVVTLATYSTEYEAQVGANGVAFDAKGNMYVCNFSDAQILKFTFDEKDNITGGSVLAQGQGMRSCDGLQYDSTRNELICADFIANAVHAIDVETGKVTTLAANENCDGSDGKLDSPSEAITRGDTIYVSNIDLKFNGHEPDDYQHISFIDR